MFLTRTVTGRFVAKPLGTAVCCRYVSTEAKEAKHLDRDIVVVGGGPAGLALAGALASSPSVRNTCKIALIEGGDLDKIKGWSPAPGTYSNRVSSLTNASQHFLKATGAWAYVDVKRTCEMEEIQAWDAVSGARITFDAAELGLSEAGANMARLTENLNLQRGLLQHLDKYPDVELRQRTKVTSISPDETGWPLVKLDDGTVIRARLLIGADGANSPVRNYADIQSYGWAYDTQGIVATMVHPPRGSCEGPNTTSYQRFLPTGPIAFLPLSPTVSSLVWSTKPQIAKALQASEPDVLVAMINAAFRLPVVSVKYLYDRIIEGHASGQPLTATQVREEIQWREKSHLIKSTSAYASGMSKRATEGIPPVDSEEVPPLVTSIQTGTIASFPLRYNHADAYLGEGQGGRTALVGDAAHTIHPLAGQGLNLGLADAECLVRVIESTLSAGGDIGAYTSLLPYSQERYLANHLVMSTCDKLHKVYSTEVGPVVWARTVGVEVLNELDTLKAAMMMTAGAKPSSLPSGWTLAGNAVESVSSAVRTAESVAHLFGAVAGSALKKLVGSGPGNRV